MISTAEAWLRTRHFRHIVWNEDRSVNVELSLAAVMDAPTEELDERE